MSTTPDPLYDQVAATTVAEFPGKSGRTRGAGSRKFKGLAKVMNGLKKFNRKRWRK